MSLMGKRVDKTAIAAITEDMYVDWEVSECYNNVEEFIDSYRKYSEYGFYTDDDVSTYRNLIRWQDDFGKIEPNKKYYDNRIINGAVNKDTISSKFIEYDTNNPQQIPQRDKTFPFWIEVHCSETKEVSIHICFRINIDKVLEENIHFILDAESKYIFPEANRILIILVQSGVVNIQKEETRNEFKTFIDEYRIKKAFGLIAGEYDIQNITKNEGEYAYLIRPVDNNTRVSIGHIKQYGNKTNNEHVEHKNVFELYKLNFEKCDFKDELVVPKLPSVRASFKDCTFEKEVKFNEAKFIGETLFQKSTFKDRVDFMGSQFGEENSKIEFSGTFEQSACFQRVTFHGNINFNGATFNGEADFKNSEFKGLAYFSTTFSQQALFSRATFNKTADFKKAKFLSDADFSNSTLLNEKSSKLTTFMESASFQEATFNGNANFSNARFQGKVDFKKSQFQQEAIFIGASFNKAADFYKATFKDKLRFVDSSFNKQVYFIESTFNDYVYFDETLFSDISDFSQSEFDKTAYFAGTKFQGFPIFLKTTFNESMSFTNAELDFDFDNVEDGIIKIYNDRMKTYKEPLHDEPKIEPYKYKAANELRDTFRAIKGTLIKDNNLLDASQFHRIELYCKELELKHRREEKAEKSGIRDVVDRIQLMFYRLTSDHHTDLMLILNNIVFLIALFGIISLVLVLFTTNCTVEKLISQAVNIKTLEIFTVNVIFISIALCRMLHCCSDFLKIYSRIRDTLKNVFYTQNTCIFLHILVVMIVYILFAPIAIFVHFVRLYSKIKHNLSYFIVALMFIFKPSSILPVLGKLIENKSSESYCCCDELDIFVYFNTASFLSETLNLVYMIFLFLLLWSLQKTARKNTIIPN